MKLISSVTVAFLLALAFGCADDEIVQRDRYTYTIANNTDFDVSVEVYQAEDGVRANTFAIDSDRVFFKDTILSRQWTIEEFLGGDSLIIRFSDGKTLTYKCLSNGIGCNTERNIYRSFTSAPVASTDEIRDINRGYQIEQQDYDRAE